MHLSRLSRLDKDTKDVKDESAVLLMAATSTDAEPSISCSSTTQGTISIVVATLLFATICMIQETPSIFVPPLGRSLGLPDCHPAEPIIKY
jgi:hypothetical protein